jgi:hydroxymethylglutaryl-CoA reductase (NADPH)
MMAGHAEPERVRGEFLPGAAIEVKGMSIDASDRLPRSSSDDYTGGAVAARRLWLEQRIGTRLDAWVGHAIDPHVFQGNIESFVGTLQLPIGVAGPLVIHGQAIEGAVLVPMATTEGALVASYSRGMKAITASGGARTRVISAELTAGATFEFEGHRQAGAFVGWLDRQLAALKARADGTTHHGRLLRVDTHPVGRRVFANFVYETAEALGINMATRATAEATAWIAQHAEPRPMVINIPGGLQGEKWVNGRDFVSGRGRRTVAEATISAEVLLQDLRTDALTMQQAWQSMALAKMQAGGLGASFHAANGAAAVMLATGQDMAYLSAFTAIAVMEARPEGDLYLSIDLPTLGVGTVGGGTRLPGPLACLELMGCIGPGSANRLAEIIAATCIAGEASTVAAIVSGEFVAAHEALGRNRPSG